MKEHVNDVLADCTNMLYAMNILRSHGLPMREIQLVFNAKILSKILYASPAWWGLMGREELLRIDSFLKRAKKLGYYHTNGKMFEELCLTEDDKLFKKIQANNNHVLRQFLPEKNRSITIFVKTGMEAKGLRVNAGKTKVMQCRVSRFQSEDSGEHPCGVCRKRVGKNSILCVKCHKWVNKRCSGISGKLKSNVDFHCRRCLEGENGLFQSVLLKEVVIEPNVKLECVPKFCYLREEAWRRRQEPE